MNINDPFVRYNSPGTFPEAPVSQADMSLNELRAVLAPSLASLFLILCLCAFVVRSPEAAGTRFHLYPLQPEANASGGCNSRAIILWLADDGRIWINETEIPRAELTARLDDIYEDRIVRRAYVFADSDVSFQQFADYLRRIAATRPKLDFVLVSGDLRSEVNREPTFECVVGVIRPKLDGPWKKPFVR
jgi:biopolymer transport protein ExbD